MAAPGLTSRMSAFVGDDDGSASEDTTRAPRRVQNPPASSSFSLNSRMSHSASTMAMANAKPTFPTQRKTSSRDYKPPLGPRPLNSSPQKRVASDAPPSAPPLSGRSLLPTSTSDNFLTSPSRRRNTAYDFVVPSASSTSASQDPRSGLSPLRFDFETSYFDGDNREPVFRGDFPTPEAVSRKSSAQDLPTVGSYDNAGDHRNRGKDVSMLPLQETSRTSSTNFRIDGPARRAAQLSAASGANSAPYSPPLSARTRRQSQFPVTAVSNTTARQPRKSIGPGAIAATADKSVLTASNRVGASASSNAASLRLNHEISKARARLSPGPANGTRIENQPPLGSDRRFRGHSLQVATNPPSRFADGLSNQSEGRNRAGSGARAPGRQVAPTVTTPASAAARNSTFSSHSPHVGGLGARTVSPTDARRMKRLSTAPPRRSVPQNPPTPEQMSSTTPVEEAPPPMPQSRITPALTQDIPDANQQVLFGRALSSRSSYSSCRPPSTTAQNSSAKSPTTFTTALSSNTKETENVPPVPAIPKVFESPSEQIEQPFFSDIDKIGTSESGKPSAPGPSLRSSWLDNRQKRGLTLGSRPEDASAGAGQKGARSNVQSLRLPPLNVFPLNNPSSSRTLPDLHDMSSQNGGEVTPPPKRSTMRTPGTPMTASKATFPTTTLSYGDLLSSLPFLRSTTSHDDAWTREESPYEPESGSPEKLPALSPEASRSEMSPKVSVSTSRTHNYSASLQNREIEPSQVSDPPADARSSRFSNFRNQFAGKLTKEQRPIRSSSFTPNELQAAEPPPLRRKLSRGWRRSSSKASHTSQQNDDDSITDMPKSSDMAPPKLPASATSHEAMRVSPILLPRVLSDNVVPRALNDHGVDVNIEGTDPTIAEVIDKRPSTQPPPTERDLNVSMTNNSPLVPGMRSSTTRPSSGNLKSSKPETKLDRDDQAAEEEMRKLASRRKDFEIAAQELDDLKRRSSPKTRASPSQAARVAGLNIYERGEVIDYKDIYFCGTKTAKKFVGDLNASAANFGFDDERGDYNLVMGDHLAYRYEVIDVLGKGSFGQVVRCIDHKNGKLVAIKIIRNKKRFHQQALVEVNILQKLRDWDPHSRHSMINFTQSFYFRGHLCISTELLGMNLYEFIKAHEFRGFSLKLIRRFTKQLLSSLILLQGHRVIHCDLKPENILLVHPLHSEIKVIDFGSSCFENEKVYTYIQSRFYRSPEVILGMTYGMPIDMWSIGCILAELLTGYPIFPGENEQEQLACIMEVFGPPEKHLIEKSTRKKLFFDSMGKPRVTVSSKGKRRRPSSKTLQQVLKCDDEAFIDFISRCLRWDPERRLKPDDALQHPFVSGVRKPIRNRPSGATSPVKRTSMAPTPSRSRPLPEPPFTSLRNGVTSSNNSSAQASPTKFSTSRRHSTISGLQSAVGSKSSSNGAAAAAMTGLPRVSQRSASGKPDLASAAAIASLVSEGARRNVDMT